MTKASECWHTPTLNSDKWKFWLELKSSINPKSSKPVSHQRHFFTYFLNSNLSIYTTINDKVTVCIKYWEKTWNYIKNLTQDVTGWAENWKMMSWLTFWKNDIGFEKPPSLSKMSLLIIHSKFDFFWHLPPFCTMSFSLHFLSPNEYALKFIGWIKIPCIYCN